MLLLRRGLQVLHTRAARLLPRVCADRQGAVMDVDLWRGKREAGGKHVKGPSPFPAFPQKSSQDSHAVVSKAMLGPYPP